VRIAALWRLHWLPPDEGAAVLRTVLHDSDSRVRRAAFNQLDLLPSAERILAYAGVVDLDALDGLRYLPLTERSAVLRQFLEQTDLLWVFHASALRFIRLLPEADRVPILQGALRSTQPAVQSAALELLDLLPSSMLEEWVRETVQLSPTKAALRALEYLRILPPDERRAILRQMLATGVGPLQVAVLHQIRWLPRRERVLALTRAHVDGDPTVRLASIEEVWLLPHTERATILRAASTDLDATVRRAAIARAAMLDVSERVTILCAALVDKESIVRVEALNRAILLPQAEYTDAIQAGLADPDWWVRRAARHAMQVGYAAEQTGPGTTSVGRQRRPRQRYHQWDPGYAAARSPDVSVSDVEVAAMLRHAQEWHSTGSDGEEARRPIVVEQHPPAAQANSQAVWNSKSMAAWLVDQHGVRQLGAEEAERERSGAARTFFSGPALLAFAPMQGTSFLIVGFLADPLAGHGELIEIGPRGGARYVLRLWLN
jgi:HEAT repeat protein